jgi:hypothetical protein
MEERLVEKRALENGLILELYDRSRRLAGDRWLVSLAVRMDVDVGSEHFQDLDSSEISLDDIRKVVGPKVAYRYEKIRNFVEETVKDEVFQGLKERFLDANLDYLSNPGFAQKLILRKYGQVKERLMRGLSQ